jgi:hypothetical protein
MNDPSRVFVSGPFAAFREAHGCTVEYHAARSSLHRGACCRDAVLSSRRMARVWIGAVFWIAVAITIIDYVRTLLTLRKK